VCLFFFVIGRALTRLEPDYYSEEAAPSNSFAAASSKVRTKLSANAAASDCGHSGVAVWNIKHSLPPTVAADTETAGADTV